MCVYNNNRNNLQNALEKYFRNTRHATAYVLQIQSSLNYTLRCRGSIVPRS